MIIHEGAASIEIAEPGKISRKLPVFYNPLMKSNRDISVLLLAALGQQELHLGLPLEASGIRGLRLLKELPAGTIASVAFNDLNPLAVAAINQNLKLNKLSTKTISVSTLEANSFLLESKGFDYIDIDPFGSPNPFLSNAITRLSRGGVLAVTATDTSALSGTFSAVCRRKYWAQPLHNELMHEVGVRILARKIQLLGTTHEKALIPILCYGKDHYVRLYFHCHKGKSDVDAVLDWHQYLRYCSACMHRDVSPLNSGMCGCGKPLLIAGPLWSGPLLHEPLLKRMLSLPADDETKSFVSLLHQESAIPTVGFYDLHKIGQHYKLTSLPKTAQVLDALKKEGTPAAPTHYSTAGIKTTLPLPHLVTLIKKIIHPDDP